ncbi:MAG: DHA2 family efflux MFS transporter permease subunit [Deltaproteobacteria bacterium]|nr:DHA2 family efflux MFS transporter permease subunit [Deltaproteobacteria bacterium]MCL5277418.1 DHA2 family efflux MFS transporter permease subunit [Deltaproteobacteria bacterium]
MAKRDNDQDYKWWVLVIVMIGSFMSVLDSSGMNIALPHFMVAFGINMEQVEWISTVYMLAFAVFILFSTWMKTLIGLKQTFLLGLSFFVVGSFLCSFAWSLDSLISFRVIQAIGAGAITPISVTMLSEVFPKEERGFALGMWGAGTTVAPAVGPMMFGYIIDHVGWRALFYINIPIGMLTLFWAITVLRPSKGDFKLYKNFDYIGFITFSVFISSLMIALQKGQEKGWTSGYITSLFAASYFSFLIFVMTEFIVRHPIMDLSIFKNYNFTLSNIMQLTRSVALIGSVFLMSMFFQNLMNYSATLTGMMLIPQALALTVSMPIAGKISDRLGAKRPLLFGTLLTAFSLYYFSSLSIFSSSGFIVMGMIMRGCGISFIMAPLTISAINALDPEQVNLGSGILNLLLRIGSSFSIAIMGVIVQNRTDFHLSNYTGNIVYNSSSWYEALNKVKGYALSKGVSFYNARIAGKGIFIGYYLKRWANVNAYDDAFFISALFVLASTVPTLMLKNIIYKKSTQGKDATEAATTEPE